MKFAFLTLINLVAIVAIAQKEHDFGILVRGNLATQTTYDPSKPEDGTFQWNNLSTFGIGAYASREIKGAFNLCTKLMYLQKGFREFADYGIVGTPIFEKGTFQNTFNYISIDLLGKFYLSKKSNRPYAYAGLQGSFLISTKIESDIYPNNEFYPLSEYGDYNFNSNSWILGLGLDINRILSIDAEVNRDFTPVVKKDDLLIKNWLWSLSMQVSLYNILKKK
ncbi:MAG: PorT family protein [Saprospiraceae bacterium]|nr:PorT family protein [Saprospiraceae bacterium]MCF8252928.1 PorT family protein [Saprospiraceae bacterium]MCF8314468.1 PorT family protein [Saprospiraceae bacterium]MCF8443355.1 PorT family protein [Saprospiraceae bacterium]